MAERTETVRTPDGAMEVFIAHPEGPGGPWPVIIQLMDGIGMREELRGHARRTASWGYYVLAPDLYYRFGFDGPLDFSDPVQRDRLFAAIGALTAERVTGDAEAVLKVADADPAAAGGKIGLYGFCMGGKLTLVLSQTLGDRVAAGASIHPGSLVTDGADSPHRHLDRVGAQLYFGIADNDATATPEQMAELERELKAHGIRYQLEWHPGALHGYMMPSRAELYNEAAAEKVWGRMEALFGGSLVAQPA
jgi:carboxymethylenebutenolidase